MKVRFNLNDKVRVRLTEHGRRIHERQYDEAVKLWRPMQRVPYELKEDPDGWSEWQMHELMNVFGSSMYYGAIPPMEMTVIMDVDPIHNSETT